MMQGMKVRSHIRPGALLVLGFLLIILLGAAMLYLPVSRKAGAQVSFFDALFVSVSSVCVTGLTTVDIADNFTIFGHVVQVFLIQLGGLGFATFAVFLISLMSKNISLSQMNLAKEALNYDSGDGVVGLVRRVILYAFSIELIGAGFLFLPYYRTFGSVSKSIGYAVFHSISAFNNAGFDLNGGFSSLAAFDGNVYVNIVIAILILLGGLGFFVMHDILHARRWSRFSFHTKIVLVMSFALVFGGMLLMMLAGTDVLNAFFLSVSARTAGFSTIDLKTLSNASVVVMLFLMFIGANPGSTGGGVKTTTMFAVFVMMFSVVTGRKPAAFKRRIPMDSIMKAFTVMGIVLLAIMAGCFGIMFFEGEATSFIDVLFEVVSAVATVGLSMSLTPVLHIGSKIIIMVLMFIGRLGPLTIAAFFTSTKPERLNYIEEHVLIG